MQDKNLIFEIFDENGTLHKCCSWYKHSWFVIYDNVDIKIDNSKVFSCVLNDFTNGVQIEKYFAYFRTIAETDLRNNLILPLPATARLLGFDSDWENSNYGDNVVLKNGSDILFDRLIIYWNGHNSGEQPSMYFLKKEMLEKYVHKIEALFLSGALGRVRLLLQGLPEVTSYFVPFYFTEMKSPVWRAIMKDRNYAIEIFTKKFYHP